MTNIFQDKILFKYFLLLYHIFHPKQLPHAKIKYFSLVENVIRRIVKRTYQNTSMCVEDATVICVNRDVGSVTFIKEAIPCILCSCWRAAVFSHCWFPRYKCALLLAICQSHWQWRRVWWGFHQRAFLIFPAHSFKRSFYRILKR